MNFQKVEFLISAANPKDFPGNRLPEIAFAGKSNVGKSSVINRILQRKNFARVGEKPGKTIHVNYFVIDRKAYLVDLPGYGYAKRSKDSKKVWSTLTEEYFLKNPSSDAIRLVIQLIDIRVGPTDDDIIMINWLIETNVPFIVVATKTDKLSKSQLNTALASLDKEYFSGTGIEVIPFSSVTKDGKELLWNKIMAAVSGE